VQLLLQAIKYKWVFLATVLSSCVPPLRVQSSTPAGAAPRPGHITAVTPGFARGTT